MPSRRQGRASLTGTPARWRRLPRLDGAHGPRFGDQAVGEHGEEQAGEVGVHALAQREMSLTGGSGQPGHRGQRFLSQEDGGEGAAEEDALDGGEGETRREPKVDDLSLIQRRAQSAFFRMVGLRLVSRGRTRREGRTVVDGVEQERARCLRAR